MKGRGTAILTRQGIVTHAFGGHVDAGLTERASGFSDDTAATEQHQQSEPAVTVDGRAASVVSPFDPGEYSVSEVMGARSDCKDAEWAAVLEAERNGKNRSGIK